MQSELAPQQRWYQGVTRYQWLVLVICSLGWIFDAFEGQLFVATMNEAMPALLPAGTPPATIDFYNNIALGMFLVGGAAGGLAFGMLSDRMGRKPAMILAILFYSCFTGLTAFVQNWWQLAGLRFVVALGVAGEWAVGTAMVAEVFPKRARAWSLAIFSASSMFGVYLAVAVGATIVAHPALGWRWGFASGVLPALLVLWVMWT
ncbi:MAG: MFS transporter, partial [Verrucomicrobia bacterium]|nr:MFS transporter [Verrucomicrobiota bacterium]